VLALVGKGQCIEHRLQFTHGLPKCCALHEVRQVEHAAVGKIRLALLDKLHPGGRTRRVQGIALKVKDIKDIKDIKDMVHGRDSPGIF